MKALRAEAPKCTPRGLAPVLAVIVSSRALVWIAARFAMHHVPDDPTATAANLTAPAWFRWDAAIYLQIAGAGYTRPVLGVFFPVYPLLGAALAHVTGLSISTALLVVSNVCYVGTAALLFVLVRRRAGEGVAVLAVACVSFLPGTVFLSAGYSESVFMLLTTLTFLTLEQGRPWLAAVIAGIAAASRPLGWALALPVAWEAAQSPSSSRRRIACGAAAAGLSLWGVVAWAAYLQARFGDALVFARGHAAWHRGVVQSAADYLPWNLAARVVASGATEALVNAAAFLGAAVVSALAARELGLRYTLFSAAALLLLYARAPYILFQGAHRHVFSLVPVHLAMAVLLGRSSAYALAVLPAGAGLTVIWTALYIRGYLIR